MIKIIICMSTLSKHVRPRKTVLMAHAPSIPNYIDVERENLLKLRVNK